MKFWFLLFLFHWLAWFEFGFQIQHEFYKIQTGLKIRMKAASIKPASSGNKNWLQLSFAFDFLILLKSINQKLEWKQPVEFQLQSG